MMRATDGLSCLQGLEWHAGCFQLRLPAASATLRLHADICLRRVTCQRGHTLPDTCVSCCCAGDVQMKFVDAYFPFTVSTSLHERGSRVCLAQSLHCVGSGCEGQHC